MKNIRYFQHDDKTWFSGRDVCGLLGFSNHSRTLAGISDSEKHFEGIDTASGFQKLLWITEQAFASLVAISKESRFQL